MNPIGRLLNRQKLKIISVRYLNSVVALYRLQQQSSTPIITKSNINKSSFLSLATTGLSCTLESSACNTQAKRSHYSISCNTLNFLHFPFFRNYVTISSAYGNLNNISKDEDTPYYAVPKSNHMDYEKERKHFHIHVPEFYNFCTDIIDKWAAIEKVREKN